jgi:hypothetical protein
VVQSLPVNNGAVAFFDHKRNTPVGGDLILVNHVIITVRFGNSKSGTNKILVPGAGRRCAAGYKNHPWKVHSSEV